MTIRVVVGRDCGKVIDYRETVALAKRAQRLKWYEMARALVMCARVERRKERQL